MTSSCEVYLFLFFTETTKVFVQLDRPLYHADYSPCRRSCNMQTKSRTDQEDASETHAEGDSVSRGLISTGLSTYLRPFSLRTCHSAAMGLKELAQANIYERIALREELKDKVTEIGMETSYAIQYFAVRVQTSQQGVVIHASGLSSRVV